MSDNERRQRYAEALNSCPCPHCDGQRDRVMTVADAEQAELRAENERLRVGAREWSRAYDELRVRAEAAEAATANLRRAVLAWAERFIPGDRWDIEDLRDLETALGGTVESHPTSHWHRETASLRAENERLRERFNGYRERFNGYLDEAAVRAEAAEAALAEERAKVARVEALHRANVRWQDGTPCKGSSCVACGSTWPCETTRALAEPTPEATERPHPDCHDDRCAGMPPCLSCARTTEGGA